MRRPLPLISFGAARRAREAYDKWWAKLSEEERARECGMTLVAYRKMCVAGRTMGRNLGESLNRLTERILKGEAK